MPHIRTQAYILSRTPLTESSWIVCLLTRQEGKLRAVAKGARRTKSPFRGAMEPMNLVEVEVSLREGRELCSLLSADLEEGAMDLFGTWPAAGTLLAVAEVLERGLAEHSAEEETFRLVGAVLKGLREGAAADLAWVYFAAWFLRLHGMLGRPDRCGVCGESKPVAHFDAGAGGWVCAGCMRGRPEQGVSVSEKSRAALEQIFRAPLAGLVAPTVSSDALKDLKTMVYLALVGYLGKPLSCGAALQ